MDARQLSVLDRAVSSLRLAEPAHPWGLGRFDGKLRPVERPKLPIYLEPVLCASLPFPYDVDWQAVCDAFGGLDAAAVRRQVAASYDNVYWLAPSDLGPRTKSRTSLCS